jgi:putative dimethyl sulfoxide reductase chaperone
MLDTAFAIEQPAGSTVVPVEVNTAELIEECLARASIYRMLAGVFIEEPSPAYIAAMREETLLSELAKAGIVFGTDFLAPDAQALDEILACEYATLFASSGGFPPVESVRLTGRFKQDPCFQLEKTYREAGFTLCKGRFEVFPDQLGVELLFVAELLNRCVEALSTNQIKEYRRLEKDIKRFWMQHLGLWVRGYCRLIGRASNQSFYREMARFLGGFAEEEIIAMGLKRLEDLDMGRAVIPKSEIQVEFNPDEPVCGGCPPESGKPIGGTGNVHKLHDLRF